MHKTKLSGESYNPTGELKVKSINSTEAWRRKKRRRRAGRTGGKIRKRNQTIWEMHEVWTTRHRREKSVINRWGRPHWRKMRGWLLKVNRRHLCFNGSSFIQVRKSHKVDSVDLDVGAETKEVTWFEWQNISSNESFKSRWIESNSWSDTMTDEETLRSPETPKTQQKPGIMTQ